MRDIPNITIGERDPADNQIPLYAESRMIARVLPWPFYEAGRQRDYAQLMTTCPNVARELVIALKAALSALESANQQSALSYEEAGVMPQLVSAITKAERVLGLAVSMKEVQP